MTVQPWTNKGIHNEPCDRCGSTQDSIPRGYGFADGKNGIKEKGYNLCCFCAEKWEELFKKWIDGSKERVQFT